MVLILLGDICSIIMDACSDIEIYETRMERYQLNNLIPSTLLQELTHGKGLIIIDIITFEYISLQKSIINKLV